MVTALQWAEPPTKTYGGKYSAFFAELAANPGKWAVFPGSGGTIACARHSALTGQEGYRWETVMRKGVAYVRCLGPVAP